MKSISSLTICLLVFSLAVSTLSCTSGKTYMKFTKQSTNYASEESWEIYSGSTKIYTSPTLANNQLRVVEACIDSSTNDQYTLKIKDSYGDSWSNGAWLQIEGIYGNIAFKNYLSASREESYALSLYNPVKENDQWKLTSGSVTGTWTEYNYADSTWAQVTLGSVTTEVSGTQYFRKTFTGIANMAAYELNLNYRYGIIAYMNGNEIYRDNMPTGPVTSTTLASGSYPVVNYHSFIRPGSEVANTQSILAIELHFLAAGQSFVDFNAYASIYAPTTLADEDEKCYIYPYETTLTASGGSNGDYIFNFNKGDYYYVSSSGLPATVTYAFSGPKPYLNGVRVWPYSNSGTAPNTFALQGLTIIQSWINVVAVSNAIYQTNTHKTMNGYFNAGLYNNYRITMSGSSSGSYLYAYEMQPVVCSTVLPTIIEFEKSSYSIYTKYDSVNAKPKLAEFTNCQINPTPAEGLTFNQATCTLTGKLDNPMTATYIVTTTINGQQFSGSFSLQSVECSGTVITALRTYKSYANYEFFTIKEIATQQTVLQVNANSGQPSGSDWSSVLCLSGSKYELTIGSSSYRYWQVESFLYINVMLDGSEDYETVLRAKFDSYIGLPTSYTFNVQYAIKPYESWYYKMGEVPSNWYNSETSGWQSASSGTYPASSNQIQLYKKTFNVASLTDVAGVVISLKYQYGVIIYLNGHEVFRKGFTGDLSTSTYSSTSLSNVNFRQISLPIRTVSVDGSTPIDYIITGTNTLAIGLIAMGPAQTTSTFDAGIRLMGTDSTSRVWKTTHASSYISGYPSTFLNLHYYYYISYSSCTNNYVQITFDDDRHEWISSIIVRLYYTQNTDQARNFIVKAKNYEDSTWTTLKTIEGMTWSLIGQSNRIWIANNKSYNQYRFENFATGSTTECTWKIGSIDLRSDATNVEVPSLSYTSSISLFKDIEMGEIYPNSKFFTDFTVTPALPNGIHVDPYTGTISGTATGIAAMQTYSVTAKKFTTGESVTTSFTLEVDVCTGGRSLITLVARTDSYPEQSSYKLYQGKGTTGSVIASIDQFALSSNLNYGDFCLNHGIYTLELKDTSTGWNVPAGYYLTVDVGAMKFEMGQVYTATAPASVTTMFSSYLPFQIEYDDWKVYTGIEEVASNWNTIDFDDSTWTVTKASNIGKSEAITVYIRRDITLDDSTNYQVLNIRMKYTGGIVAYFNGRKVARFNLVDDFDSETLSMEIHDSSLFSKFHVVLPTSGAVTGKNVMAFEIHRPIGQSSSENVIFDATGVFGINECSIGVDTIMDITGSAGTTIGDLSNFFDLTPATYGYQPNAAGTFLQWTVENLEGTKFNSFAMESSYRRTGWGFSLYGRENAYEDDDPEAEEYNSIFAGVSLETKDRNRASWSVPVGIAGFRQFKWEVDSTASAIVYISAYIFQYCKPAGTGTCPAIGDYPSVAEGEISPSECEYGFRGYSYRTCTNGQLSEIKNDKCSYKLPSKMSYDSDRYTLVMNAQTHIQPPSYINLITKFYLAENTFLPNGLTVNEKTGAIEGTATEEMGLKVYTIYGENPAGITFTTINLAVRKGECKADGNFPKTQVGEIATYECSLGGSYIGTQKRACLLGAKDGEWQKIQGVCMPTIIIVILVLVAILIIAVIVFFVIRATKKTKAVGGVRGKSTKSTKSGASKKTLDKKASAKVVKV